MFCVRPSNKCWDERELWTSLNSGIISNYKLVPSSSNGFFGGGVEDLERGANRLDVKKVQCMFMCQCQFVKLHMCITVK